MLIGVDENRGRHLLSTAGQSNSDRGEFQEAPEPILFRTDGIRKVSEVTAPETGVTLPMVPGIRIERMTSALQGRCSTN